MLGPRALADPNGVASFNLNGYQAASPGQAMYFQAAFRDTGAPQKWALSNALTFTRP